MYILARKNNLGKSLNGLRKKHDLEYSFYPRTWMLPSEGSDFRAYLAKNQENPSRKAITFIVKPEASC